MEIEHVQPVDAGFFIRIRAVSREYIVVQHAVGKPELVLIAHSAQTVRRSLADQLLRQAQCITDLEHFMHQQLGERAEITGGIPVFRGITDIILRRVAGVDHAAAIGQILSDGIERRHADPGRQGRLQQHRY